METCEKSISLPDAFIGTPGEEQETIITISRDNTKANIYTSDNTYLTKLRKKLTDAPNDYKLIKVYECHDEPYAVDVVVPKKLIRFATKRVMSEEQRAVAVERLKRYSFGQAAAATDDINDDSDDSE